MSQPVQAKRAWAGGPVQTDRTDKEIIFSLLVISELRYLTLVSHLNKVWLVILTKFGRSS